MIRVLLGKVLSSAVAFPLAAAVLNGVAGLILSLLHCPFWLAGLALFVLAGGVTGGFAWVVRSALGDLTGAAQAIAGRDAFVTPPFARETGLYGDLARALVTIRGFITEIAAAEAERDALSIQKTEQARAEAARVERFDAALADLLTAADQARSLLREQTQTLQRRADEAESNSREIGSISRDMEGGFDHAQDAVARMTAKIESHVAQSKKLVLLGQSSLQNSGKTASMLTDAATRIKSIVTEIGGFNGQTKMLALNATIEAARAGEAGKGFGVVATEVRTLSERIGDAARRIDEDIGFLQEAIGATTISLADAEAAIGQFNELANDQTEAMRLADEVSARTGQSAGEVQAMSSNVAVVMSSAQAALDATIQLETVSQGLDDAFGGLTRTVSGFLKQMRDGAIRIGVMHSLSGTMASAERPLTDLILMMIAALNRDGGLLGGSVEAVVVNPRSDWTLYQPLAEELLDRHHVAAIFGCWTSISRKAVLPVIEQRGGLLFYPIQYEGQEQSPNIYYTGATPNQQAIPAVDFLMSRAGGGFRQFYLVGTDYIYPQVTFTILNNYLASQGIDRDRRPQVLTPFGHDDWRSVVKDIARVAAQEKVAVISTINGDANAFFYRELARQGVRAERTPVMAFSIGENEAALIGADLLNGHYVAWNYLMALPAARNRQFIAEWRRFTAKPDALTDDPMEATWIGFNLWCDAVRQAGTTDLDAVRQALSGRRILAPSGVEVMMDPENHHLHKPLAIGRASADGSIRVVHYDPSLLMPEPDNRYFRGVGGR